MDETRVRQIIQEELARFVKNDRFLFDKHIQLLDARNIQLGKTNGTMIGTEGGFSGQKLGFFGTTPTTQRLVSAVTVTGSATDGTARNTINVIINALQELGLFQ